MPWITRNGRHVFVGSGFPGGGFNYTHIHNRISEQEDEARKKVLLANAERKRKEDERLRVVEKKVEKTKGMEVKIGIPPSITMKNETTETTIKKKEKNSSN